mgnify:CR=1 FL=1
MGKTQQHLKVQMKQHFSDIERHVALGKESDGHAKHFATQFLDAILSLDAVTKCE